MATAASASSSDLRWRVTEIAKCPICLEDCTNPKSLPCLHTFCLHCLQQHWKDKSTRNDVPCPVCRKVLTIPDEGLDGLPHNFFVQNLIDAREASSEQVGEVLCEACKEDSEEDEENISPATVYCMDCNQKLCTRCSRPHRAMRGGPHQVKELGAELTVELIQQRGSYCKKHAGKPLELYCFDCEVNICMKCSAVEHTQHTCQEVEKVAADLKKSFKSDIQQISTRTNQYQNAVCESSEEPKMIKAVQDVQTLVKQRGETLKGTVDRQVESLLEEIETFKTTSQKQIASRKERLEFGIMALESFTAYSQELMSKGSSCDITRVANHLRRRADELMKTYVSPTDFSPGIKFVSMNIDEVTAVHGEQNLIGRVLTSTIGEFDSALDELRLQTSREREMEKKIQQLENNTEHLKRRMSDLQKAQKSAISEQSSSAAEVQGDQQETTVDLQAAEEMRAAYSAGGLEECRHLLVRNANERKNKPLNVAVIGSTGVGKSSFINIVRRLTGDDEGAAEVGLTPTTMEPCSYPLPDNPMMLLWDLPGVGTNQFPKATYLADIGVDHFDFFLLMTANGFTENDTWLVNEFRKRKKKYFFVRSKIGVDVVADKKAHPRTHSEEDVLNKIRDSIAKRLKENDRDDISIFLIDNHDPEKFEFQNLNMRLIEDFPDLKESALVLSLQASSRQMIELKSSALRSRIWKMSALSAAVGAVPIPGLSIVVDLPIVIGEAMSYFKQLGLDNKSLQHYAELHSVDYDRLTSIVGNALGISASGAVTTEAMKTAVLLIIRAAAAPTLASRAAAEGTKFLPIIGSFIAAPASFGGTYLALKLVLDKFEEVAVGVMKFVAKNAKNVVQESGLHEEVTGCEGAQSAVGGDAC